MPEWYQVFNAQGAVVAELLAYTKVGAIKQAVQNGHEDAATAQLMNPYYPDDEG